MHMKTLVLPLALSSIVFCTAGAEAANDTISIKSASSAEPTISLAGQWQFGLPRAGSALTPPDKLTETIRLPGTMDDAGLGPKNTKKPDLSGPYRLYDYAGPAWYRRDIEVPANWKGKQLTLFLERCRWTTTVWLDGKQVGSQDSLIAPHLYNLGTNITPGRHQLTICVDNTVKIWLGTFVSALFGGTPGNMNGIIGRIELWAKPPVWIDNVQVYPNVGQMTARVVVKIGNSTGQPGKGEVKIGSQTVATNWTASGGEVETNLDMSKAKLWNEFSPNLSQLSVRLGEDMRTVRFGMRDLSIKGTQFTMNGRPLFLRGTLECSIWPLTGYPPTDAAAWRRIYRIIKSYGLNHMRFHSWCPPEAAFAVADEEGILLQIEAPQANVDVGDPVRDAFTQAEMRRILDTYGNHPSFCLMTIGNEYGGNQALLTKHIDALIEHDSRHLYSSASSGSPTPNRQWTEITDGRGIGGPATERDLSGVVADNSRPIIGHEIGQWGYFPDALTEKKYTGVMRLKNFEMVYDDLRKKHLIDLAPKYIEASGKLATLLYKEEIEVLLRTRGYAGFSLLDMHDYPTQGTALVGPLDEFWDSKGFVTPQQFRRYCAPVVPLLRMPKRTFTTNENFDATVQVAQYGAADMPSVRPFWSIQDSQGKVVASGSLPQKALPTGTVTDAGAIHAPLASLRAPGKFTVTVSLPGTQYSNSWEIWIYAGAAQAPVPPKNIVIYKQWDDSAKTALAAGKTVFISTLNLSSKHTLPGAMRPVFWSPVWFPSQMPCTMSLLCDPKHPALAQFPTEMNNNWQWWDLLERSKPIIMDDAPIGFRPLVHVVDNFSRNHMLGNLFEAKVGQGKLLFCSIDLSSDLGNRPVARQLLTSLYNYIGSDKFRPQSQLPMEKLDEWLTPYSNRLGTMGTKVISADSEAPGYAASNILNDDEGTFWHTEWEPQAAPLPHEVVIDAGRQISLKGLTVLARQDGNDNGRIADCEVYCTDDTKDWGNPVAKTRLPDSPESQTISFSKPVTARYLKLKILSGHRGNPFISLGKLDIVPTPS
ncbi:glycoside hydrolase family 2 [bacterium]|nr:MAG: glycoside hydrolase family 2 [bacterium]